MKIVSMLLSYKRPQNMARIISSIRAQTIKSTIIVFDQGGEFSSPGADIVIKSSYNFNCLPRYYIPGWIESDYIWQNDDDHFINDEHLFENLIRESEENPIEALCFNGRELAKGEKAYQDGREITQPVRSQVCNFGFSFYPSSVLSHIHSDPYNKRLKLTFDEMKYADDIWASAHCSCRVSKHIRAALTQMPEGSDSITLSKTHLHMDARNKASVMYFQKG